MLRLAKRLLRKEYEPLNTVSIFESNLRYNYSYLNAINRSIKVAPVLKSNAYGHGLSLVGQIVDKLHPPFICVDGIQEAYELLKCGVHSRILITGFVNPENLKEKRLPFSYAVWDADVLNKIALYQPKAMFHIFIDTGMHREGVRIEDIEVFLAKTKQNHGKITGIMSHLAMAQSKTTSESQLTSFQQSLNIFRSHGIIPSYIHILASGGLLHSKQYKTGELGNIARTGIAFYGYHPDGKKSPLKPALELATTLVQVKKVKKGEKIGYDQTYKAPRDMVVGILPIGYNDGVDRSLSNGAKVNIRAFICPIVGRVSMNITTVDVTKYKQAKVGDRVIIYSHKQSLNTLEKAARMAKTFSYELLVHINPQLRRKTEK